ncbi:MAG TPA: phenylalanine--tRNA ligase subunit alpha [Roseiflexaceae bacterium]|nr:phenylalanine--tRNA ligase subunit alpha [Roseiflexaceae bacterium]HMP39368.1 phenylalanine--tRNA ligase subunit alpha [Roseiflexaceae bacterium]
MAIVDELAALRQEALGQLAAVTDLDGLAEWRSVYLGKQGALTRLSRGLGALPADERPAAGQQFNQTRQALEAALDDTQVRLKHAAQQDAFEAEAVDVTLPGRAAAIGRLHPSTQTLRTMAAVFADMGFQIWESPEVETDEYNFGLLNMPADHPARDMWDTFYIETPPGAERVLLRTHTSPGQIRAMQQYAPDPIRVIVPGKCYRYEQVTARHEMQFYQVEGLAVGERITFADLKGTLVGFAKRLYGQHVQTRFRPSYFPFTEPSVEFDIECFLCNGAGCRVCKYSGWLEILGAGMVHPQVLRNGGYDPDRVSGFAFGMGPERIAMLRHGIDDIRWFFSGDERFLQQFG